MHSYPLAWAAQALADSEIAALLEVARDRERPARHRRHHDYTSPHAAPRAAGELGGSGRALAQVPPEMMMVGRVKRRYALEVPLSSWTIDTLADAEPVNGYYWPSTKSGQPVTWVEHIFEELLARANASRQIVRTFSMHDLRTTGASLLRAAHVDELVIGILLGHRGVFDDATDSFSARRGANVTQLYTKLFEPTLRQAVGVFDDVRRQVAA